MISKENVIEYQEKWAKGIIEIGNNFNSEKDYIELTKRFISELYSYQTEGVLFNPTLASDTPFRLDEISALSYFIGNNSDFKEDKGFALLGWTSVRFENIGIKIEGEIAIAMGNYFFKKTDENEVKVEYTFVYKKDDSGKLCIILHDSHFPYKK